MQHVRQTANLCSVKRVLSAYWGILHHSLRKKCRRKKYRHNIFSGDFLLFGGESRDSLVVANYQLLDSWLSCQRFENTLHQLVFRIWLEHNIGPTMVAAENDLKHFWMNQNMLYVKKWRISTQIVLSGYFGHFIVFRNRYLLATRLFAIKWLPSYFKFHLEITTF